MKTENYLGMTSHIAPPHTKQPRPRLATRAGFGFIVETVHAPSLRMLVHGIIPYCGIHQQYP